jgi:hypothetical protein
VRLGFEFLWGFCGGGSHRAAAPFSRPGWGGARAHVPQLKRKVKNFTQSEKLGVVLYRVSCYNFFRCS